MRSLPVVIFVTVCLLLCCINAKNENMFSSSQYVERIQDLEPFPRLDSSILDFEPDPEDSIVEVVIDGFKFVGSFFFNIVAYPFRVTVWIFKMIGIILPSFIWWE